MKFEENSIARMIYAATAAFHGSETREVARPLKTSTPDIEEISYWRATIDPQVVLRREFWGYPELKNEIMKLNYALEDWCRKNDPILRGIAFGKRTK